LQGRKVNSIFGEGVNPLMRKMREALTLVGLPSDMLLKHGNRRIVYGIPLAENFRRLLLGLETKPHYVVPQSDPPHKDIDDRLLLDTPLVVPAHEARFSALAGRKQLPCVSHSPWGPSKTNRRRSAGNAQCDDGSRFVDSALTRTLLR
jgi:hypothetical protein